MIRTAGTGTEVDADAARGYHVFIRTGRFVKFDRVHERRKGDG